MAKEKLQAGEIKVPVDDEINLQPTENPVEEVQGTENPVEEVQGTENPVEELVITYPDDTYVEMVEGVKMRHPVTDQLFIKGKPTPVVGLNNPENAFVRHQLEAGIFKIVQGPEA